MDTKTNWKRMGLVAGVLVMGLAGARHGRILGRASGDDGSSGGCGAPTAVGAESGTVAAEALPRKTETRVEERRRHKAQMHRFLHHRERPAHHVAAPSAPRAP